MKKHLLLIAASLLTAGAVSAQTENAPKRYISPGVAVTSISANGQYAAGETDYEGVSASLNLETGKGGYLYDEEMEGYYSVGMGVNAVSNKGIVLISTTMDGTAAYIENDELKFLALPEGVESGFCNSITPDGSRIAGNVGMGLTDEDVIMQHPVIWNRLSDGSYSEPIELPYPKTDLFGSTPQYILIDGISADGKTLAAQVTCGTGMYHQCLIYTEGADGEWTYKFLGNDLIIPADADIADAPVKPEAKDYMTEEQWAAYHDALAKADSVEEPLPKDYMTEEQFAAYMEALATTGWVNLADYMTEEQFAAYQEAQDQYWKDRYPSAVNFMDEDKRAEYNEAMDAYDEAYWDWQAALEEVLADAIDFEMNSFVLSPNGRYYAVAGIKLVEDESGDDDWDWGPMMWGFKEVASTYVFDTTDGSYKVYDNEVQSLKPRFVNDEGRLLAVKPFDLWTDDYFADAYITNDDDEVVLLQDYFKTVDPELYAWMEQTMLVTIYEWDDEAEEEVEVEKWVVGVPTCNADMTMFTAYALNAFDYEAEYIYFSYVFPTSDYAGINNITAEKKGISATLGSDGVIRINGNVTEVNVYDFAGRLVFSASNPGATVNTGLKSGAYVVKATNGKTKAVSKAAL